VGAYGAYAPPCEEKHNYFCTCFLSDLYVKPARSYFSMTLFDGNFGAKVCQPQNDTLTDSVWLSACTCSMRQNVLSIHWYIASDFCRSTSLRQNEYFKQWKFSKPINVLGWQTKACKDCRRRTFTITFRLTLSKSSAILRWKIGDCSYADWWLKFAQHKWTASLQLPMRLGFR